MATANCVARHITEVGSIAFPLRQTKPCLGLAASGEIHRGLFSFCFSGLVHEKKAVDRNRPTAFFIPVETPFVSQ